MVASRVLHSPPEQQRACMPVSEAKHVSLLSLSLSLSLAYRLLLLLRPLNSLAGYLRCDREKGSQSERDRESGK